MMELEFGSGKVEESIMIRVFELPGEAVVGERKECGFMFTYPVIDVQATGKRLRRACDRKRVSPREIQKFLGLAALQSVYGWFQGRALPSLDNFYALSFYLGARMEEIVVPRFKPKEMRLREMAQERKFRQIFYYGFCFWAEAPA